MKLNRKSSLLLCAFVAILAFAAWRFHHVPQPNYHGIGLGDYIFNPSNTVEHTHAAVVEVGSIAVPYLIQQMQPEPLRELVHKAARRLTIQPGFLQEDWLAYQRRRTISAFHLVVLGTNSITAVPDALELAASPEDPTYYYCLRLLEFAPGTEHETNALNLLLKVCREHDGTWPQKDPRWLAAYGALSAFHRHPDIVLPIILPLLHEPGGFRHIESILRFGTNAIPYLQNASASETNYVRPATVALRKLTNNINAQSLPPPALVR